MKKCIIVAVADTPLMKEEKYRPPFARPIVIQLEEICGNMSGQTEGTTDEDWSGLFETE